MCGMIQDQSNSVYDTNQKSEISFENILKASSFVTGSEYGIIIDI